MKRSEFSIKTKSTPASLTIQGQVTKDTTVKWSIAGAVWRCWFSGEGKTGVSGEKNRRNNNKLNQHMGVNTGNRARETLV